MLPLYRDPFRHTRAINHASIAKGLLKKRRKANKVARRARRRTRQTS